MNNIHDMTADEVSSILGISKSHVYNLANGKVRGCSTLPSKRVGKFLLFNKEEVLEYGIVNNLMKDISIETKRNDDSSATKLNSLVTNGNATIRTRLANLKNRPLPTGPKGEVGRVALNNLIIYDHDKTGEFNVRQSIDGDDCFMSYELINKAVQFLNKGYAIIHQFFDKEGVLVWEEDLQRTIDRIVDLNIFPKTGRLGKYYIITLDGYLIR